MTTGFDIHNYGIHRQVVIGDTTIMGKSSKILTYYPKTSPSFVSYVYEENRKVYFFRNFQPELIYDFNLVAGDSLKHKFYSGIVRETGDTDISGYNSEIHDSTIRKCPDTLFANIFRRYRHGR